MQIHTPLPTPHPLWYVQGYTSSEDDSCRTAQEANASDIWVVRTDWLCPLGSSPSHIPDSLSVVQTVGTGGGLGLLPLDN